MVQRSLHSSLDFLGRNKMLPSDGAAPPLPHAHTVVMHWALKHDPAPVAEPAAPDLEESVRDVAA